MDIIIFFPEINCSIDAISTFIYCLSKYMYFVQITTLISIDELA